MPDSDTYTKQPPIYTWRASGAIASLRVLALTTERASEAARVALQLDHVARDCQDLGDSGGTQRRSRAAFALLTRQVSIWWLLKNKEPTL